MQKCKKINNKKSLFCNQEDADKRADKREDKEIDVMLLGIIVGFVVVVILAIIVGVMIYYLATKNMLNLKRYFSGVSLVQCFFAANRQKEISNVILNDFIFIVDFFFLVKLVKSKPRIFA